MSYKHLSIEEREKISKMYYAGAKISEISNAIDRNKSTVSRELKRLGDHEYSCIRAQADYTEKRRKCCPQMKLSDKKLSAEVESLLNMGLTPEQIVGRVKEENGTSPVSQRTIYRAVNAAMLPSFTADKLPCRGRRKKYVKDERRGKLNDTLNISERDSVCKERVELGHWEGDTVRGKQSTGGILTLVDMTSRYLKAYKLEDCKAQTVVSVFEGIHDLRFSTLTFDNGKEFAYHHAIKAAAGCEVYFANPHSPWERGTNENTNGRLRRFFPKGIDMRKVTQNMLDEAVERMNNTPRKCLGYKTPAEVMLCLKSSFCRGFLRQ